MGSDAFFPQRLSTCGLGPELRAILRVAALRGAPSDRFIAMRERTTVRRAWSV